MMDPMTMLSQALMMQRMQPNAQNPTQVPNDYANNAVKLQMMQQLQNAGQNFTQQHPLSAVNSQMIPNSAPPQPPLPSITGVRG